jgi:hypothetical protein
MAQAMPGPYGFAGSIFKYNLIGYYTFLCPAAGRPYIIEKIAQKLIKFAQNFMKHSKYIYLLYM